MAKTVMIVDDSYSLRRMVQATLSDAGYEVIEAIDGRDALTKLNSSSARVHLIISDMNMPVMDGITFVKEVKTHPTYKSTPVMMLSTEGATEKKLMGREAGAKAWMVKPFLPQQMLNAVAMLVSCAR
ncbi:MAG: response regulator [Betaproteobacteria bacterium]|nr:MAG: response regulator [Betaproteobacteria bacterium]